MITALGQWLREQDAEKRLHLLRHQPSYFADAGEGERLRAWLTDFGFLEQKLGAVGIVALLNDFDLALGLGGEQGGLRLIQGALRLSAHVLEQDKTKLAGQLLGRLLSFERPEIVDLLEQAKKWCENSWFRPLTANLTPPGGPLIRTLTGHSGWVNAVAISPDGKRAVSASGDETLKLWDLEQGRELATLSGHSREVLAVAIAPDGKRAVSASDDNTLKLWDLEQGRELATLSGHSSVVTAVAISPDGKRAVSASFDQTLKLWDLETMTELATLSGHSREVTAVAISPDGKRAVSGSGSLFGSGDKTLKLWDLEQGRELATLSGHSYSVNAVAIAPDGKRAVSASDDKTLKLWDLEQGRELATLSGHSNWVRAVAIAPDGKRAVSASWDQTLKLWNLATGEEIASFTADAEFNACALAPDGVTVVAGDGLGRVHFLRLEGL